MSTHEKSSSALKIGVMGCGAWGRNLIRNFAEVGVLGAVCDIDAENAQPVAQKYNVPALSEDEIYSHPSLDGVVIASLAPLHAQQAWRALEAGKHVYIEKPMALSVAEARDICSLAQERKRILMVGHILHYHPAFMALKEHVEELGPLQHIYANRLSLGRFRRQENVLWDLASHDISLILCLAKDMPQRIHATGQAFLAPGKPANALLTMEFAHNLTAHIHTSWLSPFKEQKLVVMGQKGIAVFDDRQPWEEKLKISKDCILWKDDLPDANDLFETRSITLKEQEPLRNECLQFLTSIQTGKAPPTSGEEGLRVIQVLEQAEELLYKEQMNQEAA